MVRVREEALALVLAVVREGSTHPPPDLTWLIPSPPKPISNLDWPLKEVTWAKHSDVVKKLAHLTDYWSLSKRPPLPSDLPKPTSEQALSTALLLSSSAPSTAPSNAKPLPLSDDPTTIFSPSTLLPTLPAKATRSTAVMNSRISKNSSKPTIELRPSSNVITTQSTSSACVMSTRSKRISTTAESPSTATATGSRLSSTAIATGSESSSTAIICRSKSSATATASGSRSSSAAIITRSKSSATATATRPNPSPAATATGPNPWPTVTATGCNSSPATTATGSNSSKQPNSSSCVDNLVTLVDILYLVSSQLELFYTVQHAHLQTLRYYVCHTFSPFLRHPLLSALDKAYEQLVPGVESCWSWSRCLTVAHAANPSIFLVKNLPPPSPTFTLTDDDDHHHHSNGDKMAMKPPVGGHVTREGVRRRVLAGKRRRQS